MSGNDRQGFAMSLVGGSSRGSRGDHDAGPSSPSRQRAPMSRTDAFGDDGDGDDYDERRGNGVSRHDRAQGRGVEAVTGYSRSGAEYNGNPRNGRKEQAAPLVIPRQKDTNWMEERKRRLGLERHTRELGSLTSMRPPGDDGTAAPNSTNAAAANGHTSEQINAGQQKAGLEVRQRADRQGSDEAADGSQSAGDHAMREDTPSMSQAAASPPLGATATENGAALDDEDQQARTALMLGEGAGGAAREHVVIAPISEDEALRRDAETRPEAPTMSDYARMPVQDFGAALLRGMGWKEGMGAGRNRQGPTAAPPVQRRAALLGLGAKQRPSHESVTRYGSMSSRSTVPSSSRPERRDPPASMPRERSDDKDAHSRSVASSRDGYRSASSRRSRSPDRSRHDDERERERRYRHRDDDRHRPRDLDRRDYEKDNERRSHRRRDDDDYDKYSSRSRDEKSSRRHDRDADYDRERSRRHY